MNILIITPGYAIVPAFNGGAVEKLVQTLVDENENKKIVNFDVIAVNDGMKYDKIECKFSKYIYINNKTIKYKISKVFRACINKFNNIYIGNAYINEVGKKLKKINCNSYDCIIIENNPLYILSIKKYFNCPIYLHLHNDKLNIDSKLNKKVYRLYDKILTVSNFIRDRVEQIGHDNKSYTLYNGIDVKKFQTININDCIELKNKLKITNEIVLLYVGRIIESKGVLPLIKVFNKLNKKHKDLRLILIGDMKNNRNKYIRKVYTEYQKNRENIILKGYVDNDLINLYYHISGVQIVPSICNEALGNTAIEGISSGLVVVASNMGGLPEIVDQKCGFVFDINNFEDNLYGLLEKIIDNMDNLKDIKNNALEKSKIFDKELYYSNFIDIVKR